MIQILLHVCLQKAFVEKNTQILVLNAHYTHPFRLYT